MPPAAPRRRARLREAPPLASTDDQPRVHQYPALLTAERHYRAALATRDVLFDSPAMRLGEECARVALSPDLLAARQGRTGLPLRAVLYPEQVAFARLATRPALVRAAIDPTFDTCALRRLVERETSLIVGWDGDNEPWRAAARLQTVLAGLARLVRDARHTPDYPVDARWNILRYAYDQW